MMRKLNINIASDYLVMASWLIYIKSRTLLPQTGEEAPEEDPEVLREKLQRQLLEYQRFKRLSQSFRQAEEEQSWGSGRAWAAPKALGEQQMEAIEEPQAESACDLAEEGAAAPEAEAPGEGAEPAEGAPPPPPGAEGEGASLPPPP